MSFGKEYREGRRPIAIYLIKGPIEPPPSEAEKS